MSLPEPSAEERAALATERAKLGPNADGRITAVRQFLEATRLARHANAVRWAAVKAAAQGSRS